VLLTDFDSTIITPEMIEPVLERFRQNPRLASLSLRLLPEGRSVFSKFQDIEYAIGRGVFSRYLASEKKLRCVHGAAGIWRRQMLQEILMEHSGRHNGDDLENTAIAMRKGYAIGYEPSIVVETLVPQTTGDFFRQRRRWELGALETYQKENHFYLKQIKNLRSRLGHVTILDWYAWGTTLMFPVLVVNGLVNHLNFVIYACVELSLTVTVSYLSRNEVRNRNEFVLIPVFPLYRIFATLPRLAAMYRFLREKRGPRRAASPRLLHERRLWTTGFSPQQVGDLIRVMNKFS